MHYKCQNHNIGAVFISSIVYRTKINYEFVCMLIGFLNEKCVKNGFYFIDNSAVM